jgi:restriction endonuclease S subunit
MNDQPTRSDDEKTIDKLDELIQKKKEEIAGLQRLLQSIENPLLPETDPLLDSNEKENNSKNNV